MQLPLGVADPLFVHELALEMGKSVQEMTTGEPGMSARELTIDWPLFFAYKKRTAEAEAEKASMRR